MGKNRLKQLNKSFKTLAENEINSLLEFTNYELLERILLEMYLFFSLVMINSSEIYFC